MKNILIKLYCIALIAALLLPGIRLEALYLPVLDYPVPYDAAGSAANLASVVDTDALREYLVPEFAGFLSPIDVSSFGIPESSAEDLKKFIWRDIPESFQVYGLGVYGSPTVQKIYVSYNYDEATYASMMEECRAAASQLVAGIAGNDSLDDVQKALLIHDRICFECEYDYSYGADYDDQSYTMYGVLVNKAAVCDGYTKAYSYLLRLAGVKSFACTSDTLNHAWNLVNIDGVYYHTDVTWDDLAWNTGERGIEGGINHNNFLLSNDGIYATGHTATDYYKPDNDTRFESAFWTGSSAGFCLLGDEIYWIDNNNSALKTYSGETLLDVSGMWYANSSGSYWVGNFTRLCEHGGKLYYSTPTSVKVYDPATGASETFYTPELEGVDAIYGIACRGGELVIDINDQPVITITRLYQIKVPLPQTTEISAELSSSVDIASSQTVHAEITSNGGVAGYYWGKDPDVFGNTFFAFTGSVAEIAVSASGTYYFTAKAGDGTLSDTLGITFCRILLHTNGGTVSCDDILMVSDYAFDLPIPEKTDSVFMGWASSADAESGLIEVEICKPPEFSEYFALWHDLHVITGSLTTVGGVEAQITVTDGSETVCTLVTSGDYRIEVFTDTVYVTLSAPGHVSLVYKVEMGQNSIPDTAMYLTGDVNCDGTVNNKDVAALFKAVTNETAAGNPGSGDCNGDGAVNNKDVALLFRHATDNAVPLGTPVINKY